MYFETLLILVLEGYVLGQERWSYAFFMNPKQKFSNEKQSGYKVAFFTT